MHSPHLEALARLRQDQLLREAERDRLARQARPGNPASVVARAIRLLRRRAEPTATREAGLSA
jgi:hypothetical protein